MSFNMSFKLAGRLVSDKLHLKIQNADLALKHISYVWYLWYFASLAQLVRASR